MKMRVGDIKNILTLRVKIGTTTASSNVNDSFPPLWSNHSNLGVRIVRRRVQST